MSSDYRGCRRCFALTLRRSVAGRPYRRPRQLRSCAISRSRGARRGATVASARALLRDRDYDLLLADGILPDGTGFMVAEDAERRGIQAIIVTAYAERFAKEDLARFGLLIKPVRPDELLSAVDGALGR